MAEDGFVVRYGGLYPALKGGAELAKEIRPTFWRCNLCGRQCYYSTKMREHLALHLAEQKGLF